MFRISVFHFKIQSSVEEIYSSSFNSNLRDFRSQTHLLRTSALHVSTALIRKTSQLPHAVSNNIHFITLVKINSVTSAVLLISSHS